MQQRKITMDPQRPSPQEDTHRQPDHSPSTPRSSHRSLPLLPFSILLTICCLVSFQAWSSQIHEHGFWITNTDEEHAFDPMLADALGNFLLKEKAQQCVDFGAGKGDYVRALRSKKIVCDGFDGNPYSPDLSNGVVNVADLSQPLMLPLKYDWVLSLEVGEHIPKQYEKTFVNNLMNHCVHGIVLSWAVENQRGYGHCNCQNNDYIKKLFSNAGYSNDVEAENSLRAQSKLSWFKNTIMVFRKDTAASPA